MTQMDRLEKGAVIFERFTERARQVVTLAQEEARLHKQCIGTEHILLGLIREQDGLAAKVLGDLGVSRAYVTTHLNPNPNYEEPGQIPFDALGKKALELALREALSLGHNYIGTEHILLGIARLNEGDAIRILAGADIHEEDIRQAVMFELNCKRRRPAPDDPPDTDTLLTDLIDKIKPHMERTERSVRAFLSEWQKD